jgi:uncharacterized protein YndB with AHSA1/START domain
MPDILHRVGVDSSADKVFAALCTIDGLSHWWIKDTSGDPQPGGIINFGFCDMKVIESRPDELVRWKCVRGPEEWLDTELTFRLKPEGDQTFVLFTHADWKEAVDFMHHCSTKWATFLLSLKDWLERNQGRPVPDDVKIHVGD